MGKHAINATYIPAVYCGVSNLHNRGVDLQIFRSEPRRYSQCINGVLDGNGIERGGQRID